MTGLLQAGPLLHQARSTSCCHCQKPMLLFMLQLPVSPYPYKESVFSMVLWFLIAKEKPNGHRLKLSRAMKVNKSDQGSSSIVNEKYEKYEKYENTKYENLVGNLVLRISHILRIFRIRWKTTLSDDKIEPTF